MGGRIIKDKLFFFGGYQRLSSSSGSATTTAKVPTADMIAGNFLPANSTANGVVCFKTPQQLLNPITGAVLPNDVISPSYFDKSAMNMLKYLPPAADGCGNVSFSIPVFQTENQYITREDWTISQKHTLYGRYFRDDYVTPALWSPTNILLTANPGNTEVAQTLTFGETWTISSTMVNTVHVTGTRRTNARGPAAQGINAASLGSTVYQPYRYRAPRAGRRFHHLLQHLRTRHLQRQ